MLICLTPYFSFFSSFPSAVNKTKQINCIKPAVVYAKTPDRPPPLALRKAIEQINAEIHARGESMPEFRGMGTTCTTLVLVPQGAV